MAKYVVRIWEAAGTNVIYSGKSCLSQLTDPVLKTWAKMSAIMLIRRRDMATGVDAIAGMTVNDESSR